MAWMQDKKTGVPSLEPRCNSDGSIDLYCYASAAAMTRKTKCSVQLGAYGWTGKAIADTSDVQLLQFIGFPKQTITTSNYGWVQIAGYVSDAVITTTTGTVGHAVKLATDTVVTTGAAPSGNDNEFAVFETAGSAATYDLLLFGVRIDGAD